MKTMKKILGLFLLSIAFVSCGSDDDGPEVKQVTEAFPGVYTSVLQAFANNKTEISKDLELKDIMGDKATEFVSAQFQNNGNFFKVDGVKKFDETLELKDFTITIGNAAPVNLGTCKVNAGTGNTEFLADTELSGDKYVLLSRAAFQGVISGARKVAIKVSFTSNKTITEANNVTVNLNIAGLYTYNTYPNGK